MNYEERTENDILIISANGEIDLENSNNLGKQISNALEANTVVSIEMSEVNHIDSSGVAALIESKQKAVEAGKEFKILKPSEAVLSVLKLAKLESFFDIEQS